MPKKRYRPEEIISKLRFPDRVPRYTLGVNTTLPMRWQMRITATVLILIISLHMAGPAIAEPLEDATKAYEYGDYKTAYRIFGPLAEQGLPEAQYYIAVMYRNGQSVPEDYVAAAKWCKKAAEQGYAPAQSRLGFMYKKGQGVPQDYAEAAKWFGNAAEQEYAPAMYHLGIMYRDGQGVLQDNLFAHMWFNLAASLASASQKEYREQAVTERDAIATKLPPAQITDAQRMAREWKPKR
jgi:uncharacterized protein